MKKKTAGTIILVVLLMIAYLGLWPVPIQPVSWKAPRAPGYTGAHAVNSKLTGLSVISLGAESAPEHIVVSEDGKLYASVTGGNVLRMDPDGANQKVFVNTGGRPLGLDFDAVGNLIVADAHRGLLSVSAAGEIKVLADKVDGDPIRYTDAVVVASNGTIYFSDASTRFAATSGVVGSGTNDAAGLDILEQSATGRILEYRPDTGNVRIVARGLSFANGVALSRNEDALFVAETGRYRVWRIAVTAEDLDVAQASPLASVLLDNLPGFPDNLMRGLDGKIWVGLPGPRLDKLDEWSERPGMRKLLLRLPKFLLPTPRRYGHAIAFTETGEIVADLQDPTGGFPRVTGITERTDRLYVHTLNDRGLGVLARTGNDW